MSRMCPVVAVSSNPDTMILTPPNLVDALLTECIRHIIDTMVSGDMRTTKAFLPRKEISRFENV